MEIRPDSPKVDFTCKEVVLNAPLPFKEGDTLSDGAAAQLNQVFIENIRNNFGRAVEDAKEDAERAGSELDVAALQAKLDEYVTEYDFGKRTLGGTRTSDPIASERRTIAVKLVKDALKRKGVTLKDVDKATFEGYVEKAIADYPQIDEEARRRVAAAQSAVGGIDLDV